MTLTAERKRDAEWLLDWSANISRYGMSYTRYERYRLLHGRKPPKAGCGKRAKSPRHRGKGIGPRKVVQRGE